MSGISVIWTAAVFSIMPGSTAELREIVSVDRFTELGPELAPTRTASFRDSGADFEHDDADLEIRSREIC